MTRGDPAPGHASLYDDRYHGAYMSSWPAWKRQRIHQIVAALPLPATGVALDFGCGTGVFTGVIAAALPGWQVYGSEISEVALARARTAHPSCRFVPPSRQHELSGRVDFLFTHHVLEHVEDLAEVWRQCAELTGPRSHMLHVLPCGNPGSLEHDVCSLTEGGIEPTRGNRFFFEEPAHLRRLTTREMAEAAAAHGFRLAGEYYANQRAGALRWVTRSALGFIRSFADPPRARDRGAHPRLWYYRLLLLSLWALRLPALTIERIRAAPTKTTEQVLLSSPRARASLASAALLYPISWLVNSRLEQAVEREWQARKHDRNGSEMYLHFVRG